MTTVKKVSIIASSVLIAAIGGFGIYEWFTKEIINTSTLIFLFLGIGFLFQSITWGEFDGKQEAEKDEMEKHITLISSKISYYVLLVVIFIVLVISEGGVIKLNEIKNTPLVIVLGFAFITMPITEFIVSKKYR